MQSIQVMLCCRAESSHTNPYLYGKKDSMGFGAKIADDLPTHS